MSEDDGLAPFAFQGFDRDFFPLNEAPYQWPPTPRPRLRHNAGGRPQQQQQPRRPFQRRRPLLDWPEEDEPEAAETRGAEEEEAADCWSSRIAKLFLEDGLADVTFVVREDLEDGMREVKFKAHKFILSLRSPVFHAMFFGPLAERSSEIPVPDVTPAAFKAMLAFIYKDSVGLQTLQGAWQLWYAAKKYLIESLEERCRKYLKAHLTPLNVLDTYAFAEQYGDSQVLYQCLRLIDHHARHILFSSGFTNLSIEQAKNIIGRRTLNAREVDIFEGVVRWIQAEIERRLHDDDEGKVHSLKEMFNREFKELIQFTALSSQDFVHHVLPQGVLENESIGDIATQIRQTETVAAVRAALENAAIGCIESGGSPTRNPFISPEPRLGLNQARDLLFETPSPTSDSFLRSGVVHTVAEGDRSNRRCGPGYYQLSRFSPRHELALVWKWPREYSLKFRTDKSVYLLGACITETDRQFYSPKVKYFLKLKDASGKIISDGSETFIKKTSNKYEGGFPKALDYGPHDVSFRNVAHIYKDKWYELSLKISEEMWSVCPLLVCKCKNRLENFGVGFEFEPNYVFSKKGNNMEGFKKDFSLISDDQEETDEGEKLTYGLISRLYFFY